MQGQSCHMQRLDPNPSCQDCCGQEHLGTQAKYHRSKLGSCCVGSTRPAVYCKTLPESVCVLSSAHLQLSWSSGEACSEETP